MYALGAHREAKRETPPRAGEREGRGVAKGVFLYRLSTSRVEKSGADSLCGVVRTGLFSSMTASRLGFHPVG